MKKSLILLLALLAILVFSFSVSAQDKKISQLPALPSITGNEAIPLALSGSNYYVTPTQLKSWLNIIGYVPLAGTGSGMPLTGTIEFDNSVTHTAGALWQNSATGSGFYLGITNNSNFVSSSHGSYALFQDGNFIVTGYSASGAGGIINLQGNTAEISAHDASGNNTRFFQISNQSYIQSNNPSYVGLFYEATTASYVASNGGNYTVFHRAYNDARYLSIANSITINGSTQTFSANPSFTTVSNFTFTNGNGFTGTVSNASSTPALSLVLQNATTSQSGQLTSTDWNTFNNKQAALSGTGYVYQSGSTTSYTTSIPNASLSNSTISGVALGSNLFSNTAGYGLSGSSYNGSAAQSWVVDTTAVASKLYVTAKIASFITNTVTTLSSLSSVGTVTTGVWNSKIIPVVGTVNSTATVTINTDSYNMYTVTSLSTATTFTVPTGTPADGQSLIIRVKDNGSSQTLSFSTGTNGFRFSSDNPAPSATTSSKTMYLGFKWNAVDSKWDNVSPYIDNF